MHRNVVERCFNRPSSSTTWPTCYTKRAACYRAELLIAAAILWLR